MNWLPRFIAKIAWPENVEDCWLWTASIHPTGYGSFQFGRAHRVAYELRNGPIPDGLTLDHLCRVRNCVNPDHLEAVTRRVNILRGFSHAAQRARQTHCIRGHPFDEANTHIRPNGTRRCRACDRARHQQ